MFNSKVVRHSTGIKEVSQFAKGTSAFAAKEYMKKQEEGKQQAVLEQTIVQKETMLHNQEVTNKVASARLLESQMPMMVNNLTRTGKEILFKEIMFEMFSKALVLDQEFVLEQEQNLRAIMEQYIDTNGGYALLENAYKRSKSVVLKNIMNVCESVAGQVTRRKMTEIREGTVAPADIRFELNEEEQDQFNYEKEKVSVDELSDLVKKKVLTVIQDERSRQQREEEIFSDLEQQASDEGTTVEEAMQKSIIKGAILEESTLFNSLFRHSYKEVLTESVASVTGNGAVEDEEDNDNTDVNTDSDDVQEDEFEEFTTDDIKDNEEDDEQDDFDTNQDPADLDMDLILAESITKYTLMEMAYTIKLEDYSTDNLRKLSQKLLN